MASDKHALLELTPDEQQAADRDAALVATTRAMNGPNAPSIKSMFPSAIPMSRLVSGAMGGKMHVVKLALREGADVNEKCVMFGSPLHAAASKGRLDIVQLLVACGADVKARDGQGKTAAEVTSQPEIAEFLRASS